MKPKGQLVKFGGWKVTTNLMSNQMLDEGFALCTEPLNYSNYNYLSKHDIY